MLITLSLCNGVKELSYNSSMTKEQKDHKMRMLAYTIIRDLLNGKVDAVSFTERARDAALDLGLIAIDDEGVLSGVVVTEGGDSIPEWYRW